MELVIYAHQSMFKPFKFWADYSDNEWAEWTSGLPTDIHQCIDIPDVYIPKIDKKLNIYTPQIRKYLKEMSFKQEEERRKSILELANDISPTSSDSSISPYGCKLSPMRKFSFDKIKPLISPTTPRRRRTS